MIDKIDRLENVQELKPHACSLRVGHSEKAHTSAEDRSTDTSRRRLER